MEGEYMVITGSAKEVEDELNDLKRNWRFDILGFTATDNTTTALIFATLVNYPPKPITVDEMAKQIRNFVQVMSIDEKGNKEFLEKRVTEYLEQYAQYREKKAVLEALEREFMILNKRSGTGAEKEYYETEVKPKYEE